jgi:trans-aconitate 2-methyltransferase
MMTDDKHAAEFAGTRWVPDQYMHFSGHRLRPALELLARVPLDSPRFIVDLGCGAGNVTRILAQRWRTAAVLGVDNSGDMLSQARAEPGDIAWQQADVADWRPEQPPDLIYSNAALHWTDRHEELFPRLAGFLRQGGCLAVQMPLSWDQPSHRLMREILQDCDGGGRTLGTPALRNALARKWVQRAEVYYELLSPRARSLDIWATEYLQVMEGEDPVLQWVQATGLRPILNSLAEDEREVFLAVYRKRLREAYPPRPDGRTLFPFARLFIVAVL